MKNKLSTLITFCFCLSIWACSTSGNSSLPTNNLAEKTQKTNKFSLVNTVWFVKEFVYENQKFTPKKNYQLNFDETKFGLHLDVNSCGGTYTQEETKILFGTGIFCTEMCCDGKEAKALFGKIIGAIPFQFKKETGELILTVDKEEIILTQKKIKD